MKEQAITLDGILKGLRPYENMPRNQETLTECFNLIPRPQGLIPSPTITESITSIDVDHPWPQILLGHTHWVCAAEEKIYTINGDWSLTQQLDLSPYYGTFPNAPKGAWHIADVFSYMILTNGGVTVLYNPYTSDWEFNDVVTIPTLGTVCNFNGQLIGSGRATIVGDPKTIHPDASEVDETFLIWGRIGSANFRLDQSNVAGYRPMPGYGEIYKVLKLGERFVVYSSNRIFLCRFVDTKVSIEATLEYGIASRDAVGGDEFKHVAVDATGSLRVITPSSFDSEPIYKEFFDDMLGNEIVVTMNPYEKDYYITDGVISYCLTRTGLGEVAQAPTTLTSIGGTLRGFYTDLDDDEGRIVSDVLDFEVRGRKTIDGISVGSNASDSVYVAVDYKYNYGDEFETTDWIEVNPEGNAVITISGIEFRFRIKCDDYAGFNLDYFTVKVKFDDKRQARGINVNKTTT